MTTETPEQDQQEQVEAKSGKKSKRAKKPFFTQKTILIGIASIIGLWLLASAPAWTMQSNPPVVSEPAWDSDQTRALAKRACFDCHSNETKWPLYSRFAPVAYSITSHVVEGREALNFSEWGTVRRSGQQESLADVVAIILGSEPSAAYANGDEKEEEEEEGEGGEAESGSEAAEEMIEEIEEGSMPLPDYLPMHPEARLNATEKQQLIDGIRNTFR